MNLPRKLLLLCLIFSALVFNTNAQGRFSKDGIIVGLEYAGLDTPALVRGMSRALKETGLPGMKPYSESIAWGEMQKAPNKPIDFSKLDLFIREYQNNGFTELSIALKSHSRWASVHSKRFKTKNPTPKRQYRNLYSKWIRSIVERYDADGLNDMPGLKWAVRYYEIGSEFSSYEPEPVEEYLSMLAIAYKAAHQAFANVIIAHAAFLPTPVNLDVKNPRDYERRWKNTKRNDKNHDLKDIRTILDRPRIFDVVNVHNLGDAYEIEHINTWLQFEMKSRGYKKPIIISDTIPTSYIGWGAATKCTGKRARTFNSSGDGKRSLCFGKLLYQAC